MWQARQSVKSADGFFFIQLVQEQSKRLCIGQHYAHVLGPVTSIGRTDLPIPNNVVDWQTINNSCQVWHNAGCTLL